MQKNLSCFPFLLILLLVCPILITAQEEITPQEKVFFISLEGMIDGGLYSSVERRTKIALAEKPTRIIFEIDTYGGRLEPAFDISEP